MSERSEIPTQRQRAAQLLREHKDELVRRWMEKIHLLAREKGESGFAAEQVLNEAAGEFIELLLSGLEGEPDNDLAGLYTLILDGRQHKIGLADFAYVLLELKSISKQLLFERIEDELEAFQVSRLADDVIEAVLRKSADLYEVTAEADQLTAQERLQEIFVAWEIEEALSDAQTPAEVCSATASRLRGIWDLAGVCIRMDDPQGGGTADITAGPRLPVPLITERRQYLTDREAEAGGVVSLMERVRRRREMFLCADVQEGGEIVNAAELTKAGVCGLACCPLVTREQVTGVLLLCAAKPQTFQPSDARRLGDFAGVVALALERTGRLERSRKEISEAEVIARIGRSLLELPTREALLQAVAEALRAFRDYFDVSLFRVDDEKAECVLVAEAGRGRRYRPDEYRQRVGQGFIGICAQTGETIRAADLGADSRRLIAFDEEYRARCELAVPVKKGEKLLGVMHVLSDRQDDFPPSDVAALEHVSPHIGVALQNARMIVQQGRDRYEIEEAHRQIANIIWSATVGITSCDTQGYYTHWSPSCQEMLGYTADEVVGRMTPADFAAEPFDLQKSLADCVRRGRVTAERAVRHKGGALRIVRETCVPMEDQDGRRIGFTAYLVDITEQKQAEEQIRRERDTLKLMVDAMGAGLALYDAQARLQWANGTFLKWFNLAPSAFGKECHDVCRWRYCDRGRCPIEESSRTHQPQARLHELTDASGVWHCYQQIFTPVAHGETRMVVLTLDVTEQLRQSEEMLLINKLAEKVETTLDLGRVFHLVLTCVTAGHGIGFNRAFIFLLDEDGTNLQGRMAVGPISASDAYQIWADLSQKGQTIDELLESASPSASDARLTMIVGGQGIPMSNDQDPVVDALRTHGPAHVRDARANPHLSRELVEKLDLEEFVCVPLAAPDGPLGVVLADNKYSRTPIGRKQVELLEMFSRQAAQAIANARAYEKIMAQLKELQLTRDRLIEAERLASVGRMASHLAHEIRNPLTAIGGFASSIAREHKDDAKTHRNATIIYEEARRLERTLVNVLDYTRPLRPNKVPVRINDIIGRTMEQFKAQCQQGGVLLKLDLAQDLPLVMADGEMVKQVIINLVKNSLEAMENKDGGTLSVSTARDGDAVRLVISDTGSGMDRDTVEKLFIPFFTTKIGGIGLGLSVVQRIVRQHEGRIVVGSQPGGGSTFTIIMAVGSLEQGALPEEDRPQNVRN